MFSNVVMSNDINYINDSSRLLQYTTMYRGNNTVKNENNEIITLQLDNVDVQECEEIWTESGININFQNINGSCYYGIEANKIWLYPAMINFDISDLNISKIEIDIYDNCREGCTKATLLSNSEIIDESANSVSNNPSTLTLFNDEKNSTTNITIYSYEGAVEEVRIYVNEANTPNNNTSEKLRIDNITPTEGLADEPIEIIISGDGFDHTTRVSMYVDTMNKKDVVSTLNYSHAPYDVVVSDNKAYVADDVGLQIIDVSVKESPKLISELEVPGNSKAIALQGQYAYIAAGDAGLQIIDIAQAEKPKIISNLNLSRFVKDIEVDSGLLFLVTGYSETTIEVIDVRQPENPTFLSSIISNDFFNSISLEGNRLYVTNGSQIEVIDVSHPEKPIKAGFIDISNYGSGDGITVNNNHVYVSTSEIFLILDFTDLNAPLILGSVQTEYSYRNVGVAILNNKAFLSKQDCGVCVVDISKPAEPVVIGKIETPIYTNGITIDGTNAYVACEAGLQIVDIDSDSPKIISSIYRPSFSFCVQVKDNIAYAAGNGLQIIDISDPITPKIIGIIGLKSVAQDIEVSGNNVFIAGNSKMEIIDISDISNPQRSGVLDISSYDSKIFVNENHVYLKTYDDVKLIDASNPNSPDLLGPVDIPRYAPGLAVSNNIAYIANGDSGLQIYDISNQDSPTHIGYLNTSGYASHIIIENGYVYIAGNDFGVEIIDVKHPTNPKKISTIPVFIDEYDNIMKVKGNRAYIGGGNNSLKIYDLSNLETPSLIGIFDSNKYIKDIDINEENAILTDSYGNIQIVSIHQPKMPRTLAQLDISKGIKKCVKGYNQIYAVDQSDIHIVDTFDIEKPLILASISFPCRDLEVIGYRAYIVDQSSFSIVDISDFQQPNVIGNVNTDISNCHRIVIVESEAYVCGDTGVQVFEIPDPNKPIEGNDPIPKNLALIEYINCLDISVHDKKLYITSNDQLQIVNLINTQEPQIKGQIEYTHYSNGIRKIFVSGNTAFVVGTKTFTIIDVQNEMEPRILASLTDLNYSDYREIVVADNIVYLTDESSGVYAIDITKPDIPLIIGSVDTCGKLHGGICVFDDIAYVGTTLGIEVVRLPVELKNLNVVSETAISANIQFPQPLEHYIVRVFNNSKYDELIRFNKNPIYLRGDLNNDNLLDLSDVVIALQLLADKTFSDFKNLSRVNLKDVIFILNEISIQNN